MKNIYITWHYTTHGVAYLKHILSQFYLNSKIPEFIDAKQLEQDKLHTIFDTPTNDGFVFDEIIYLVAKQDTFDSLSSRRFGDENTILEDEDVIKLGLDHIFKRIIKNPKLTDNLEAQLEFVKTKYPKNYNDFENIMWRIIEDYPIEQQTEWLTKYSNFKNIYQNKLKVFELNVPDLTDEKQISDEVNKWTSDNLLTQKNIQPIINVSLASSETQVVWHILAEANQLPKTTRFIKTYDNKSNNPKKLFKPFSIHEIPTNLISTIGAEFKVYNETKSPSRALVNKKMDAFIKSGFSILLIGERGTGKSNIANDAKDKMNPKNAFVQVNCASFDEDSKAEAELFGYKSGAFTGANKDKIGLIEEANGGVLFLDEIHHLSKLVQAKLMKALQTDKNNKMSIRKMGDNKETKVECQLIFATNKNINELRTHLLTDFYDRIVQHVINIPPLRETVEDRFTDWETIWRGLKFNSNVPNLSKFRKWLKEMPLYGNFRDLQKIAIYYNIFEQFDGETKALMPENTAFEYAKNEFNKYHAQEPLPPKADYNFNITQTTKEMLADYLFEMQAWAVSQFKGRKPAIEHFNAISDTVTEKTFNDWKNKKSIQK